MIRGIGMPSAQSRMPFMDIPPPWYHRGGTSVAGFWFRPLEPVFNAGAEFR